MRFIAGMVREADIADPLYFRMVFEMLGQKAG